MEKYKELFVDVAEDNGQVDWWELKMLLDKSFHAGALKFLCLLNLRIVLLNFYVCYFFRIPLRRIWIQRRPVYRSSTVNMNSRSSVLPSFLFFTGRSMIALYDGECSGELGFFEFMKLWLNIKKWKVRC